MSGEAAIIPLEALISSGSQQAAGILRKSPSRHSSPKTSNV